jgi:23S rRNA (guanosine2251-2'-O)-methyltransferase
MAKPTVTKFRKNASASKHSLNWLWGHHSVAETLRLGRWRVYELFATTEVVEQYSGLIHAKVSEGIELHVVSHAKLAELTQTADHEGIVARVSKYPYRTIEEIKTLLPLPVGSVDGTKPRPLFIVMDRIQDTAPFASILRCCKEAGVCGVLIGEHCQSQVTTQIARSSFGAVNHFPIFQSSDIAKGVAAVRDSGFMVVAYDPNSARSMAECPNESPIALVIGSDTQRVASNLLAFCDHEVGTPLLGKATHLPVMVSAGILLYTIRNSQNLDAGV